MLIPSEQLEKLWAIRKTFSDAPDFAERFLRKIRTSKSNEEFFEKLDNDMKKQLRVKDCFNSEFQKSIFDLELTIKFYQLSFVAFNNISCYNLLSMKRVHM